MLFSIIMPVYNAEKILTRSIESVLKQTLRDFEIIIVDDGSTDDSWNIIKKYESDDKRVIALHQDNAGPGAARNRAISISRGEYIAFLDADDYWEQDFLETILRVSDEKKSDLIFVETVKEREDGSVIKYLNVGKNKNLTKYEMICSQMTGKMPWGMSKVIRKDLVEKAGNGFLNINVGEEAIFSYEVLKRAQYITFADKVIYHYVQSGTGQHTKGNYDPWKPLVEKMKEHLLASGEYDKYEDTINSLALKALAICIYRCSFEKTIGKSLDLIRINYIEYKRNYDFSKINKAVLDKNTLIILELLKKKLFIILVLASKIRKMKMAY